MTHEMSYLQDQSKNV